ncbi:hypothetical protein V3C99_006721 [Haemonchus contortus]|uniref:Amidohydrolase n=1 Tax=Haemonchus contortus TaxID=6289 RepID=A0A7I5EE15_HAECO
MTFVESHLSTTVVDGFYDKGVRAYSVELMGRQWAADGMAKEEF